MKGIVTFIMLFVSLANVIAFGEEESLRDLSKTAISHVNPDQDQFEASNAGTHNHDQNSCDNSCPQAHLCHVGHCQFLVSSGFAVFNPVEVSSYLHSHPNSFNGNVLYSLERPPKA